MFRLVRRAVDYRRGPLVAERPRNANASVTFRGAQGVGSMEAELSLAASLHICPRIVRNQANVASKQSSELQAVDATERTNVTDAQGAKGRL